MKKNSLLLQIAILLAVVTACGTQTLKTDLTARGISRELAESRRERISNLKYDVSFSIPEEQTQAIAGEIGIMFDYVPEENNSLILDFRQTKDMIKSLQVNGKDAPWEFIEDHIVIGDSLLTDKGNRIAIAFKPGERSLNRNEDYLYTLFVPDRARTVFPCFEQPDMKASFTLTLDIPSHWTAVANSPEESTDSTTTAGRKRIKFAPTEPLSTYLFAFAAGKFDRQTYSDGKRTIGAYYRETDPARLAQLPEIFKQVADALDWQEEFTARKYPFAKYDLVILPGFQFGGMEHTGATFYNDNSLFLGKSPTPDNELRRASLIAHETTHMWFGDYVTMKWFDDVWTKEVFANYFAAAITRELLPHLDHDLEWIRDYAAAAMTEDRSEGGTVIRQQLDNMNNAGLIYNNIIYNKAPIMMEKLVEIMGKDAYREAIRKYVASFPYGNATWDELVDILQSCTDADVKGFSDVWVYQPGLPNLKLEAKGEELIVEQIDPKGNGNLWPQQFKVMIADNGAMHEVQVKTSNKEKTVKIPLGFSPTADATIIPNSDGKGYGLFLTSAENMRRISAMLADDKMDLKPITRLASLMNLNENYLSKNISADEWLKDCLSILEKETDKQTGATIVSYLSLPLMESDKSKQADNEKRMWNIAASHPEKSVRKTLLNTIVSSAETPEITDSVYKIWKDGNHPLLDERNYMQMAYQLAIRMPGKAEEILVTQRERLSNPDRIREFDFISRAAVSDQQKLDALFESLKDADNRKIEPWTASVISLLNHPLREKESVKYIRPALELLPEVQETGDIFFPGKWCSALLSGHRSPEAAQAVRDFLAENPDFKPLLKNKILNGAYALMRANPSANQN